MSLELLLECSGALNKYKMAEKLTVHAGDIDPVTVKIANWLLIRQPEL